MLSLNKASFTDSRAVSGIAASDISDYVECYQTLLASKNVKHVASFLAILNASVVMKRVDGAPAVTTLPDVICNLLVGQKAPIQHIVNSIVQSLKILRKMSEMNQARVENCILISLIPKRIEQDSSSNLGSSNIEAF